MDFTLPPAKHRPMAGDARQTCEGLEPGSVTLYDHHRGNEGHRAEYYALFERLIGARRTGSLLAALASRRPVLVGALEASMIRYVVIALVRAAMGRRTAGILFRPLPVLDPRSLKLRMKRGALRLLLRFDRIATLTILPFSLEPRFAEVAASWIHDPQFWDLHYPGPFAPPCEGQLALRIRAAAGGRQICCAIGRQDVSKGFDQFAALYAARPDVQRSWLFAFGGDVRANMVRVAEALERAGGFGHPSYVDHDGLLDLYAAADLVWCSYTADYDQASGVFGRAVQLGVPVVVRRGSLLERYCRSEGIAHLSHTGRPSDFDPLACPPRTDPPADRIRAQGAQSVRRLLAALGLD